MTAYPHWKVRRLRIGVIASDGNSVRKVAWVTTAPSGIYFGIGNTLGVTTKLSYHTSGEVWREVVLPSQNGKTSPRSDHMLTLPPISMVKDLVPFQAAGIQFHDHLREFPFKKMDELVFLDARRKGGVSFNLGLMGVSNFKALHPLLKSSMPPMSYHIITRTDPWIVIWSY
jgi:hypothetical protein